VDVEQLVAGFKHGKRLGLLIRNEDAHDVYTTSVLCALFEAESGGLFDVRQTILGHMQQGGDPSPFDRIQATRLAARCIEYLIEQAQAETPESAFIGLTAAGIQIQPLEDMPKLIDEVNQRPKKQWWMDLRSIAKILAQTMPQARLDT